MSFAILKPISFEWQLRDILRTAAEDRHCVINPTHLVDKDGVIVGHLSIANTPIIVGHFSTRSMKARDSFSLIHEAEEMVKNISRNVIWPIGENSPFNKYFPRLGYTKLNAEPIDLFIKEFNVL